MSKNMTINLSLAKFSLGFTSFKSPKSTDAADQWEDNIIMDCPMERVLWDLTSWSRFPPFPWCSSGRHWYCGEHGIWAPPCSQFCRNWGQIFHYGSGHRTPSTWEISWAGPLWSGKASSHWQDQLSVTTVTSGKLYKLFSQPPVVEIEKFQCLSARELPEEFKTHSNFIPWAIPEGVMAIYGHGTPCMPLHQKLPLLGHLSEPIKFTFRYCESLERVSIFIIRIYLI